MIDTTARTIISAQESSRDPHNDVDYVTGFESGDEEHPGYRSCMPRSGNQRIRSPSRLYSGLAYAKRPTIARRLSGGRN